MYCSGNSLQLCGGPNVLTLFVSIKSNAQGLSSDYKTMTQRELPVALSPARRSLVPT
jgi:hypothetical protein